MKKILAIILFSVFIFLLVISYRFLPKDYTLKYQINNIDVFEKYDYHSKYYYFKFRVNNSIFDYAIKKDYISSNKLISNLKYLQDTNCLNINSVLINDITICKMDDEYYTSFYNENNFNIKDEKFDSVNIYNLKNHKYYLWNYNYFIFLSNEKKSNIELFDADVYNLDLAFKNNNDLLVANYDDKYTFNMFYKINADNNKISKIRLNIDLYFDSYILGTYKDYAYLYDMQKENEYRIDLSSGETIKNNFEYLEGNKWVKTTKSKLSKKQISFNYGDNFYFDVKNDYLIYNTPDYKLNVSNIKVDKLVETNDFEAFFISGDTLYYVNIYSGISKVLSFKEWKYNKGNIFVF